jgi:hypothetical protein
MARSISVRRARRTSSLSNEGDATFRPGPILPRSSDFELPIAVDIEADGAVDVMAPRRAGTEVAVFQNSGGGDFVEPVFIEVNSKPRKIGAGDPDGDGYPEVIILTEKVLLLGNSSGFLSPPEPIFEGESRPVLEIRDLDADGVVDMTLATYVPELTVFLGSATGTFSPPLESSASVALTEVTVGDLDGDGDGDIAATNSSTYQIQTLVHDGQGGFTTGQVFDSGHPHDSISTGDLTGDGSPDVIARRCSNSCDIALWRNRGQGNLVSPRVVPLTTTTGMVTLADVDGDASLDILVDTPDEILPLLSSNGFLEGTAVRVLGAYHAAADVDLDGDQDILTADSHRDTVSYLENASGEFLAPRSFPSVSGPYRLFLRELDGEGGPDLVVGHANSQTIEVFRNAGGGSFVSSFRWTSEKRNGLPLEITGGDLDGDGKAEVIVSTALEDMYIFENNGNGSFESPELFQQQGFSVAAADLEGDGDLDIVASSGIVRANRGDGTFEPRFFIASIPGAQVLAIDLDGDGDPDPIILEPNGEQLVVIANLGGMRFEAGRSYVTGQRPGPVVAGDLDSDGSPELVMNQVGLLRLMIISSTFAVQSQPFHRGDSNGDGVMNLSDGLHVLEFLFRVGERPVCLDASDANDDAALDVSDPIVILSYLFLGTAVPAPPGPPGSPCGRDPTWPGLGCQDYPVCPRGTGN